MEIVIYILALVAVLTLLAIVHEGGHFLAAKLARVGVESFQIGAGPAIWHRVDRTGTRYELGVIPVGAFTTLSQDGSAGSVVESGTTFDRAAPSRKLAIAAAGAAANFGVAFVILMGLQVANVGVPEPTIQIVDEDAAAFRAGLRSGDRIVAVDGFETVDWRDIGRRYVNRLGDSGSLEVRIARDGQLSDHSIAIVDWQSDRRWIDAFGYLGIRHAGEGRDFVPQTGLIARVVRSVEEMVELTFDTVGAALKVVSGSLSIFSFGGALQLTHLGEYGGSLGLLDCLKLFALCSIAGGIVNLLPGPIVDGTAIGLAAVELVRGERLDPRSLKLGTRIGWVVGLTPLAAAVVHESVRLFA